MSATIGNRRATANDPECRRSIRNPQSPIRNPIAFVTLVVLVAALPSCARHLKPIFEERQPAIVWPPSPGRAQIRYVGQLRSSADLKPAPSPLKSLGRLLVGREQPALLYGPRAVACTKDGSRVWIADPGGRRLHLFDLENRVYKKITRAGDTQLLCPVALCLGPQESIYVCDSENVAIHRFSATTGALLESLRLPEDLIRPVAVSYHSESDALFVVDVSDHDVKVLGRDGAVRRVIGRRGDGAGEFNFPSAIADDGDMIWIVDTGNHRVQGLRRSGEPVIAFGQAGDAPGDLALPKGIAVDSDGHIYVVDARFENVQIFDRSGRLLLFFGEEGIGPGEFWLPAGVFIGADDRIWICDSYNGRVQVFEYLKGSRIQGAKGSRGRGVEDSRG